MLKTAMGLLYADNEEVMRRELKLVADAGFEALNLDLGGIKGHRDMLNADDWKERAAFEKKLIQEYGFQYCQGHAPGAPHVLADPVAEQNNLEKTFRAIDVAAELGISYLVVHPYFASRTYDPLFRDRDAQLEANYQMYHKLVPYAEDQGVHIATENIFAISEAGVHCAAFSSTLTDLNDMMDAVPGLTCCLDYGHAQVSGEDPAQLARGLGARLTALHLHHNNRKSDLHLAPFINFEEPWADFCAALHDIHYQGSLCLECGNFVAKAPQELHAVSYAYLHASVAYLAKLAE